jgi:hypothetical protein
MLMPVDARHLEAEGDDQRGVDARGRHRPQPREDFLAGAVQLH